LVTLTGLGYLILNNADWLVKDRSHVRITIYVTIAVIFVL